MVKNDGRYVGKWCREIREVELRKGNGKLLRKCGRGNRKRGVGKGEWVRRFLIEKCGDYLFNKKHKKNKHSKNL